MFFFETQCTHSRQWFNTLIPRSGFPSFVWSRLSAPVELSTFYTTPDTAVENKINVALREPMFLNN